jgi:hypothetical protein
MDERSWKVSRKWSIEELRKGAVEMLPSFEDQQ